MNWENITEFIVPAMTTGIAPRPNIKNIKTENLFQYTIKSYLEWTDKNSLTIVAKNAIPGDNIHLSGWNLSAKTLDLDVKSMTFKEKLSTFLLPVKSYPPNTYDSFATTKNGKIFNISNYPYQDPYYKTQTKSDYHDYRLHILNNDDKTGYAGEYNILTQEHPMSVNIPIKDQIFDHINERNPYPFMSTSNNKEKTLISNEKLGLFTVYDENLNYCLFVVQAKGANAAILSPNGCQIIVFLQHKNKLNYKCYDINSGTLTKTGQFAIGNKRNKFELKPELMAMDSKRKLMYLGYHNNGIPYIAVANFADDSVVIKPLGDINEITSIKQDGDYISVGGVMVKGMNSINAYVPKNTFSLALKTKPTHICNSFFQYDDEEKTISHCKQYDFSYKLNIAKSQSISSNIANNMLAVMVDDRIQIKEFINEELKNTYDKKYQDLEI